MEFTYLFVREQEKEQLPCQVTLYVIAFSKCIFMSTVQAVY